MPLIALKKDDIRCISTSQQKSRHGTLLGHFLEQIPALERDIACQAIQSDKLPLLQSLLGKSAHFWPGLNLEQVPTNCGLGCNSASWHWELWEATLLELCCLFGRWYTRQKSVWQLTQAPSVKCHICTKKITEWVLIAVDFYGSVRLRGEGLPWSDFRGTTSDVHLFSGLNFKMSPPRREAFALEWHLTSEAQVETGVQHERQKLREVSGLRGKWSDCV